jgi:phosphatidylglycerol:prolipoprotein diacylglycerol transferase
MLPFIHIGHFALPTFGLLMWLAAVAACGVLHVNFRRHGANADAVNIVATTTLAGVIGAKLWHVLESPHQFAAAPFAVLFDREGFAWYGGLVFGILTLIILGRKFPKGPLQLLDLAAPAAAVGYGVGRLACFVSGDGDYGIASNVPWAMAFPNGLVPTEPGVRVHPTPVYELFFGLALAAYLWWRGRTPRPLGLLTAEFLVLSGIGRFLVEIIRRNPKIYFGMSNAQVASLATILAGLLLGIWSLRRAHRSSPTTRVSSAKVA